MSAECNSVYWNRSYNDPISNERRSLLENLHLSSFDDAFALAYKILRREDLAFEAVSDAEYTLLTRDEELFAKIDCLKGYFFMTVYNRALKILQKQKQTLPIIDDLDKGYETEELPIEKLMRQKNRQARVRKVLDILSKTHPRYGEIITLFYLEGLSHKEIAKKINISEGTSKTRLSRAKDKFKALYKSTPPDNDPNDSNKTFGKKGATHLKKRIPGSNNRNGKSQADNVIKPLGQLRTLYLSSNSLAAMETILNAGENRHTSNLRDDNSFCKEIQEGHEMLLEDYGVQERVCQLLNRYKRQLSAKLFNDVDLTTDNRRKDKFLWVPPENNDTDCKVVQINLSRPVVTIVGCAGAGKTVLAKSLLNNHLKESIQLQWDWVLADRNKPDDNFGYVFSTLKNFFYDQLQKKNHVVNHFFPCLNTEETDTFGDIVERTVIAECKVPGKFLEIDRTVAKAFLSSGFVVREMADTFNVLKGNGMNNTGVPYVPSVNYLKIELDDDKEWGKVAWLNDQIVHGQDKSDYVPSVNYLKIELDDDKEWGKVAWLNSPIVHGQDKPDDIGYPSYASALDIVAHEITHEVTDSTSRLGYRREYGVLNEAYTDVLTVIISNREESDTSCWDWRLEEKWLHGVSPLGAMPDRPTHSQPICMEVYVNTQITRGCDFGGVHLYRGSHNKAPYVLLSTKGKYGQFLSTKKGIAYLLYHALTKLADQDDLSESREVLLNSARLLFMSNQTEQKQAIMAINVAFEEVGDE